MLAMANSAPIYEFCTNFFEFAHLILHPAFTRLALALHMQLLADQLWERGHLNPAVRVARATQLSEIARAGSLHRQATIAQGYNRAIVFAHRLRSTQQAISEQQLLHQKQQAQQRQRVAMAEQHILEKKTELRQHAEVEAAMHALPSAYHLLLTVFHQAFPGVVPPMLPGPSPTFDLAAIQHALVARGILRITAAPDATGEAPLVASAVALVGEHVMQP